MKELKVGDTFASLHNEKTAGIFHTAQAIIPVPPYILVITTIGEQVWGFGEDRIVIKR